MHRARLLLACVGTVLAFVPAAQGQSNPDGQLPVFQYAEPYLILLRDPTVHKELDLTPEQERAVQTLNEAQDGPLLATRNQSAEQGLKTAQDLISRSREQIKTILDSDQQKRLNEIELWVQGLRSLLRKDVIEKLGLTDQQQKQIQDAISNYQKEFQSLREKAQAGEPLAPLEKKNTELLTAAQKSVQKILKPDQRSKWGVLLGKPLDPMKLGTVKFKAPELVGQGPWVNSRPLTLENLRGKVVALHFWTFGCSNCIHNYPSYHNWMKQFADKDVVLLGIHTPEGSHEHDVETLQKKAAENNLSFPILVDNESLNWNAWGNSMWPTVYLIDKQGYVRYWWMGELNWQGQEGEKRFARHIEELLAE